MRPRRERLGYSPPYNLLFPKAISPCFQAACLLLAEKRKDVFEIRHGQTPILAIIISQAHNTLAIM